MNNDKKRKAIVLSMVLAAAFMLPSGTIAQPKKHGGVFGYDPIANSARDGAVFNRSEQAVNGSITNYGIGETVPLGGGLVFLLAAGYRNGTSLNYAGSYGYYWSSSYFNDYHAYLVYFCSYELDPQSYDFRNWDFSVRLVRNAE